MTAFDDPRATVPPARQPGTFFARCADGSVPLHDFFVTLEAELRLHSAILGKGKALSEDFFHVTAKEIERHLQEQLARLRISRDQLPGSIFRKERRNIYTIKHELVAKQLGVRFAVYRYDDLHQWVVTHAFFKTTATWPESEFDRVQDIMRQVKSVMEQSS